MNFATGETGVTLLPLLTFPQKVKHGFSYDPSVPLLEYEMKTRVHMKLAHECREAALFIIAKNLETTQMLSTEEWISNI